MLRLALSFVLLLVSAAAAAEEFCPVRTAAVLDARLGRSIHLYLPASFNGRATRLMIDTGAAWSSIREAWVTELGLRPQTLRTTQYTDAAGGRFPHYASVPNFKLGPIAYPGEPDFLIDPEDPDDKRTLENYGGTIGAERITEYDVEIDNVTKTVTLYWPNKYCSGRLVHWADAWIEIPYTFNYDQPILHAVLDGEKLDTLLDTGATYSLMDLDMARKHFGLTPSSPGVESKGEQRLPSGRTRAFYAYTFKTLTVSGLTFNDVRVSLGDFEDTPLVLGMHEIDQLHLYIASKRKIIYVTRRAGATDDHDNSIRAP